MADPVRVGILLLASYVLDIPGEYGAILTGI